MTAAERESQVMRHMLRTNGIYLDDVPTEIVRREVKSRDEPVDRDAVREILVAAGAPGHDIEWLVRSCQSLEDARAYRPPQMAAWCPMCDEATLSDANGCVRCQAICGAP